MIVNNQTQIETLSIPMGSISTLTNLFQCYAAYLHVPIKEYGCILLEYIHRFGGKEPTNTPFSTETVHLWMTYQIIGKATSNILTLHNDIDMLRSVSAYLIIKNRVVCTTKYDGIYQTVLTQQIINVTMNEVISTFALCLTVLH